MPCRLTVAPRALGFPKIVPIVMGEGHANRGLSWGWRRGQPCAGRDVVCRQWREVLCRLI